MALTMILTNTDVNYGTSFDTAYLRVDEVLIKPNKNEIRIDLRGYATAEARELVNVYVLKREELDALRKDPESDDEEIERLENELGNKPIGIYRDRLTITFDDFIPHCTNFTKDDIIAGCYTYLKTLDKYLSAVDS